MAVTLATQSLAGLLVRARKSARPACSAKVLHSAGYKQGLASHCFRSILPHLPYVGCDSGISPFSQLFPDRTSESDKAAATDNELCRQCERVIGATTLSGSLVMVALPANAIELPFDLPPDLQGRLAASLILGVLYFFVIPLLLYIYLDRRWAKRKMFEAIIQFWLVFLFFPGMLLLAPFLNFRQFGQEAAKEPWDDIRPS